MLEQRAEMDEMTWTENRLEVGQVARMLVDAEVLSSARDVVDFLEKPWKWEPERALWLSAGRPRVGEPGWELFAARLDRTTS